LDCCGDVDCLNGNRCGPIVTTKPLRAFIPFAAGSATDLVPRAVFEPLAVELGQPIVIENRGGAGGTIAGNAVVRTRRP
jgi:tripartite-type tricarboxylate transporter receptor subunit TctC